jgi:hypothetical protein
MPIAMGYEHEELEDELEVRCPAFCFRLISILENKF